MNPTITALFPLSCYKKGEGEKEGGSPSAVRGHKGKTNPLQRVSIFQLAKVSASAGTRTHTACIMRQRERERERERDREREREIRREIGVMTSSGQ